MRVLDNVERIAPPSPEVFRRDYLEKHRPVILNGLFDGQAMRSVDTEDKALAAMGSLSITVKDNYTAFLAKSGGNGRGLSSQVRSTATTCSFAEYVALTRRDPKTLKMCIEGITPAPVLDLIAPPAYCESDTVSLMFIGNKDNYAHLHFDGDHRHVLFHQVYGIKRVSMIPLRPSRCTFTGTSLRSKSTWRSSGTRRPTTCGRKS